MKWKKYNLWINEKIFIFGVYNLQIVWVRFIKNNFMRMGRGPFRAPFDPPQKNQCIAVTLLDEFCVE